MIKVSVIIPCYNSYKYMEKCIKSLENQIFKDFEVIFVDDCSTDSTYIELEKHLQNTNLQWRLIRNNQNSGPGVSRNNGIEKAIGNFVCFMDSDDWYEDNFLQEMYSKCEGDNLDIAMCDYFRRYSNGKTKTMQPTIEFNVRMSKSDYLARSFDSLCCMIVRRELFDGVKMPSQFNAEDVAVIPVLISKSKSIGYVSKSMYNYFYREGSLSTSSGKNKNVVKSIVTAYDYICENISDKYEKELEFIGIKNILYGAVICALESNMHKNEIEFIINSFEDRYPNWNCNDYIKYLSKSKKIFIQSVKNRNYPFLILLSKIRKLLFKIKVA